MKKVILLLALTAVFACKNESKTTEVETEVKEVVEEVKDELTLLDGNFVYYEDAAVLQTPSSLFGVIINEKSKELAEKAKPFKKEATDMVKARIKGTIEKKPEGEEGWDFRINIKEIISVKALDAKENEVIKLEKQ